MLKKDYILLFMLLCYLIVIILVYNFYNNSCSISNIICNDECKNIILLFLLLMGIGAILYEIERDDKISLILIILLLIGIYGLISINEKNKIHYIFAFFVFIIILLFMIRHFYKKDRDFIVSFSLLLEILILINIILNIEGNIFLSEIIYILNFAIFYLYLHFI